MSCSNSVAPLYIPYENVSLFNGIIPIQHGLNFQIGNPPQQLSFLPSLIDDSFSVANLGLCENVNKNTTCTGQWGGLYDPNNSSTYHPATLQAWNGTHNTNDGRALSTTFNDEVRFVAKSMYGFPIAEYTPAIFPNQVGLGGNSTFLSLVVSQGLAPSTSFGLWGGSSNLSNPVCGSLILGGFDKARIRSELTTFNATSDCLACVYVKSIDYNTPDGSSTALVPESTTPVSVSLSPEIPDMELPSTAFNNLVQMTGATHYAAEGKWGWPAGTKLGNVTLTFDNNYKMTVPADELWQPFTGYDSSGNYVVLNDSITISRLVNRTDGLVPNFGFPFFASTYMIVHPAERSFALAEPVLDATIEPWVQSFCQPDASTNGAHNNVTNGASSSPQKSSSSQVGPVVGGVVGGIAGITLVAGLLWLLMHRKKKTTAAVTATDVRSQPTDSDEGFEKPELPDHGLESDDVKILQRQLTSELPGVVPASELAGPTERPFKRYEMAA